MPQWTEVSHSHNFSETSSDIDWPCGPTCRTANRCQKTTVRYLYESYHQPANAKHQTNSYHQKKNWILTASEPVLEVRGVAENRGLPPAYHPWTHDDCDHGCDHAAPTW